MESPEKDLLGVEEVAQYLGVRPVTIYRWCREGRLPCVKLGKVWRIRRSSLEEFIRGREQARTLTGFLNSFIRTPDRLVAVVGSQELMHRVDAAFFQVGEARGAFLAKFYVGEDINADQLRAAYTRFGLDVRRLEHEGRMIFVRELDPLHGRASTLKRVIDEKSELGMPIWGSFDWTEDVDLDTALRQQEDLSRSTGNRELVLKTAVLSEVVESWPARDRLRMEEAFDGVIWATDEHVHLTRIVPLPHE